MSFERELSDEEILRQATGITLQVASVMGMLDRISIEIGVTTSPAEFVTRFFEPAMADPDLDACALARTPFVAPDDQNLSVTQINFLQTSRIACAFGAEATLAGLDEDTNLALIKLTATAYWGGLTDGYRMAERANCATENEDGTVEVSSIPSDDGVAAKFKEMLREHLRRRAESGGIARAERYKPVQDWVISQWHAKNWPSPRRAAVELSPDALKLSKARNCPLSEDSAFGTVYRWILAESKNDGG